MSLYKDIIYFLFKTFYSGGTSKILSHIEETNKELAKNIKEIEKRLENIKKFANDPEVVKVFNKYVKNK